MMVVLNRVAFVSTPPAPEFWRALQVARFPVIHGHSDGCLMLSSFYNAAESNALKRLYRTLRFRSITFSTSFMDNSIFVRLRVTKAAICCETKFRALLSDNRTTI
jgi:hypothetical protein